MVLRLLLASALTLSGCAISRAREGAPKFGISVVAAWQHISDQDLCDLYYPRLLWPGRDETLMDELISRGLVEEGRREQLRRGEIDVGMNECELEASWGSPTAIRGKSLRDAAFEYRRAVVYFEDGVVADWRVDGDEK